MRSAEQALDDADRRVTRYLNDNFSKRRNDAQLLDAMRYATLAPAKRIRPCLVYSTARLLDMPASRVDHVAAAVELIHSYSLIHDDLPSMDDDDYRRGQPSCHKKYDEALATLAGDAIQAMAFEVLTQPNDDAAVSAQQTVAMVAILARHAGTEGMASGQALDVAAQSRPQTMATADDIERIHRLKTGALMEACVQMTLACASRLDEDDKASLRDYAREFGLSFQIKDDLLDEPSDDAPAASPTLPTLPSILGRAQCERRIAELFEQSMTRLARFGDKAEPLRLLSRYIIERSD